ncbi:hypothetical protein NL676_013919 [Syzygium grande]|nr:hypothetical protein NL676_013919 [Syzygium grande]
MGVIYTFQASADGREVRDFDAGVCDEVLFRSHSLPRSRSTHSLRCPKADNTRNAMFIRRSQSMSSILSLFLFSLAFRPPLRTMSEGDGPHEAAAKVQDPIP